MTAPDRLLWVSLAAGTLVSALVCAGLATRTLVLGSHEGAWFYLYVRPFSWRLLMAPAAASIAALLLLGVRISPGRREWMFVLTWIVFAMGVDWMLRSSTSYSLESLFVSDSASSFYGVSQQYHPSQVLAEFNRIRLESRWHAQSNMPGKVMLVYALRLLSERTDVLPWLIVALSNLGAAFMYVFVRDLLEDRRTALFSAVLYLFVPARIFFFPIMNTVTPVVVLGCACVLLRCLRTGNSLWAILLGVALYGLVFFEPLPLAMGLLGAGLAMAELSRGRVPWERLALQSTIVVVAFVALSELVNALTGFQAVRAFRQIGGHAVAFNVEAGRPYWLWVRANLLEFLVGVGGCQAVMLVGALVHSSVGPTFRSGAMGLPISSTTVPISGTPDLKVGPTGERVSRPMTVLCLGLLAVLVALDLMGINRGEVVRLWIFLACFFQIPAAYACSRLEGRAAMALVVACSLAQAALGAAMIGFVVP